MPSNSAFFEVQTEQSAVKAHIVSSYFSAWSRAVSYTHLDVYKRQAHQPVKGIEPRRKVSKDWADAPAQPQQLFPKPGPRRQTVGLSLIHI